MKSQDAKAIAPPFFSRWICQHGASESGHSDQVSNFENRLFNELCMTLEITKTRTTPGHPQINRQVEGRNRTLIGLLKVCTKEA